MSEQIVDDTRHELVLSYLEAVLVANRGGSAVQTVLEGGAVDVVTECCHPSVIEADSRITSVALRFLGKLIEHGAVDPHVSQLPQFAELMEVLERYTCTFAADTDNACLRSCAVEALRSASSSSLGHQLFSRRHDLTSLLLESLLDDPSIFVRNTAWLVFENLCSSTVADGSPFINAVERYIRSGLVRGDEAASLQQRRRLVVALQMLVIIAKCQLDERLQSMFEFAIMDKMQPR
ncbi:hypothetical protein GQ42DRAFT_152528 [Ramicandelaber brevisporus]|nr:hypothetical protein GQ42DRAFT_152528 [Ramicandelaber brevisporus]